MHAVHLSGFRVLTKAYSKKSFKLGALKDDPSLNAYELVKSVLQGNTDTPLEDANSKLIVSIPAGSLNFDDAKRIIHGYVLAGRYGENYTVRHKDLSSPSNKDVNHDEVAEYKRYILMYLPDSLDTGVVAFHESARLNPRTPIKKLIESEFRANTPQLEARVRALQYKDIPTSIKNSEVMEIKAVGYKTAKDTADAMRLIGNRTTGEFIIKNHGSTLGKMSDFLATRKTKNKLIELIEKDSEEIKITAKINGKNKVYNLDNVLAKGISITLDDAKLNIDPATLEPDQNSLYDTIKDEINDTLFEIYGAGYSV